MPVRINPQAHKFLEGTAVVNKVRDYVGLDQWHVDHIRHGLREADTDKFATNAKVKRVIARLLVRTPA